MTLRLTHTYALLAVARETYEDVKARLLRADPERYKDELTQSATINMYGLALTIEKAEEPKKEKEFKRKSRRLLKSELWAAAVIKGQTAITKIEAAIEKMRPDFEALEAVFEELQGHKDDYSERLGNIPENLQNGEFAEKLRAIDELDGLDYDGDTLSELTDKMSELSSTLDECEAADLPKD